VNGLLESIVLMKLLFVQDIQRGPVETVITFLEMHHGVILNIGKENEYWIELLQRALDRKQPVGVAIDEHDRITRVARADNDIGAQTSEVAGDWLDVRFLGHDGTFRLRHDHPDFTRLRLILDQSIAEKRRLWFVSDGTRLILTDLTWVQPEGEPKAR
jgi:hypothetical protein